MPQCLTKSAFERNLRARANSKNPSTTFTLFIHPPDLGNLLSNPGKAAKNPNGKARASPNPPMPMVNCIAPDEEESVPASSDPNIGPVHEKETRASVNAIKNIPTIPPAPSAELALFVQDSGRANSKYPKNERAKIMNMTKKNTFNATLVDMSFNMSGCILSIK